MNDQELDPSPGRFKVFPKTVQLRWGRPYQNSNPGLVATETIESCADGEMIGIYELVDIRSVKRTVTLEDFGK